jgi:hypothetical protein
LKVLFAPFVRPVKVIDPRVDDVTRALLRPDRLLPPETLALKEVHPFGFVGASKVTVRETPPAGAVTVHAPREVAQNVKVTGVLVADR